LLPLVTHCALTCFQFAFTKAKFKTVHLRHFAAAKIKVLKPYFCPYITLITADQIAQLQERTIALKEYLQIESKRVEIRNLEKTFSPILEQF
jgi:hypothetical protein